jgi:mono/diheme cytochrome c family protein
MKRITGALIAGGILTITSLGAALTAGAHGPAPLPGAAGQGHMVDEHATDDHHMGDGMMLDNLDELRKLHQGHAHGHDFESMQEMSPEQQARVMALMHEIGVAMPPMDSRHGRQLFLEKGCVACHAVNGVGGDLGPDLDAADMPRPMNAFEFAARMWRGAPAMAALQQDLLGEVVSLEGQDLADLVAFAHDAEEQSHLTDDQVPERFRKIIDEH